MRPDSSQGSRPLNISYFTGEGEKKEDNQAKLQQLQDQPKDHVEELVEINLLLQKKW